MSDDVGSIRARLTEVENELFGSGYSDCANVLSRSALQLGLAREQRRAALVAERQQLLARLPPTGEASGQRLVMASTLGTVYLRESPPQACLTPAEMQAAEDQADPFLRYMHECNENWR